jgi:hypothetical protein
MTKALIQFLGRKVTAASNLIDRAVAVDDTYTQAGIMQAHLLSGKITGSRTIVGSSWAVLVSGTSDSPVMLRKIEVANPSGGDLDLSLGVMTVNNGTPDTSNALLAWGTTVPDGKIWTWSGAIPLVGRYFYAKGSALGMTIYTEYQELTP